MKWVYVGIGFVGLFWLATTSAAPLVVGLLGVALLYQWGNTHQSSTSSKGA